MATSDLYTQPFVVYKMKPKGLINELIFFYLGCHDSQDSKGRGRLFV